MATEKIIQPDFEAGQSEGGYVPGYIRRVLADTQVAPPVKQQAGKLYDTLNELYRAHQSGGIDAAREVWETVQRLQPELKAFDPDAPPAAAAFKPDDDMIAIELAKHVGEDAAFFYSQWRIYEQGVWRVRDESEFRRYVRTALRSFRGRGIAVNQNRIVSLAKMLADDLFIKDREIMDHQQEQAKYVNLRNGLFNLETFTLEPHRRDLYFMNQLDFDYDEKATVHHFQRYLDTSLVEPDNLKQTDESLVRLVLESLGYCFTARTDMKTSFWLWGGKDCGKSTFITLLKNMMGELYTTIDLNQLGTNRFLLAGMVGKRVIGFAEGESNTVLPDALYKTLTGGSDEIFADVKNRNPITFRMEGKIVWAMNNLPRITDRTGATTRRVKLIPYNRTFAEDAADRVDGLEQKLIAERAGIFNLAMLHLRNLTEFGNFAFCAQSERLKQEYIHRNDTEKTFLDEMCETGPNHRIRGSELYDAYKAYCDRFGYRAKNMNQVAEDWRRLGLIQKSSNGSWWHGAQLAPVLGAVIPPSSSPADPASTQYKIL